MTRQRHCKAQADGVQLRLQAPFLLLFGGAVLLAWDAVGIMRIGLLCAVLHEGGHLLAYWVLLRRAPRLQISPFGICLSMRGVLLPPLQELWLAAAGPLANLLLCSAAIVVMEYLTGYHYAGYWFASANLLLGAVNLLPLPGLDGARMLQAAKSITVCGLQSGDK